MEPGKLTRLSHLFVTVFLSGFATFMVAPSITDVTMAALCPGKDECSLAIYLTGFQQAIIGVGTMVMMPLIGNLSDHYGRKALLTLPMALAIFPPAILAYSRTTNYFYGYYVIRTVTAMVCEGSLNCLALAYLADNVTDGQKTAVFGIVSGIMSASFVCGTLAARFLSTATTFQVATFVSMLAVAYMRIFLQESMPPDHVDDLTEPILKETTNEPKKVQVFKKIPSARDLIFLVKSSSSFSQVAVVAFFNSLAEGGIFASLLYFLKALFHFDKNDFADIMLIIGVLSTISQLLLMPMLAPYVSERKLLSIGIFACVIQGLLNSIAWAAWVPYAATAFALLTVIATPCLRSIASKQVGPREQGMAQGCISGISSFANIISPLIFSPLTALFLSPNAPFNFPGFSIMCITFASMISFVQSLMIKSVPSTPSIDIDIDSLEEA